MGYIHRTIKDKPDIDSVLEKEEPVGVGMEFIVPDRNISGFVIPKVVFMYHSGRREIYVRTLTALDVTLLYDGFPSGGLLQMAVDPINNYVFFAVRNTGGPWLANTIYRFTYDPDTGLVISAASAIHTASTIFQTIYVHPASGKLYGDFDDGVSISRMNLDGSNLERLTVPIGNAKYGYITNDENDLYIADTGTGTIFKVDLTTSPPTMSFTIWLREDSSVFGGSTWHEWGQINVDEDLNIIFMSPGGGGSFGAYKPTTLRSIIWPEVTPTPTSHPPSYSTIVSKTNSGGMAWDLDVVNRWLYIYRNGASVLYRYDYTNGLLEDERLIVNLSDSALGLMQDISMIRLG